MKYHNHCHVRKAVLHREWARNLGNNVGSVTHWWQIYQCTAQTTCNGPTSNSIILKLILTTWHLSGEANQKWLHTLATSVVRVGGCVCCTWRRRKTSWSPCCCAWAAGSASAAWAHGAAAATRSHRARATRLCLARAKLPPGTAARTGLSGSRTVPGHSSHRKDPVESTG